MNKVARYVALAAFILVPIGASAGTAATGSNHTIVRASDGTVWTWGANSSGQLGMGDTTLRKVPTQVTTLSDVTQVASGLNHNAALKSDGTVWTWGLNNYGQLGDGTTTLRKAPVQVLSLTGMVGIACGDYFCLAVKSNGTVWGWGYNGKGQLGDGTSTTPRKTPVQSTVLTSVATISAGTNHSLAVKTEGTVWSWGSNSVGQLGNGTQSTTLTMAPTQVATLAPFTAVSASNNSSRALKSDGTVWAWGDNGNGQLGDGTTENRLSPVPLGGISSAAALGTGWLHTLATRSDDTTVWAWGQGTSGQLGDGAMTLRTSPIQVPGLSTIGAVSAGHGYHSVAVTTDGVVWAWGLNTAGQVGDGTTVQRNSPVALSEPNYNWLVATPTFSVAAGTYSVNQTVALATATAGATIHYTTSGATPTTSDPSGTSVLVNRTMTLKARAVKAGRPSSNVAVAGYVLMPVAPAFSPVAGTYTTAQTVTITTSTANAYIRYTTDGTEPGRFSPIYSAPLVVNTTTTVKATAFKNDGTWTPSPTTTATYTMNFGTLAAPTTSPGQGGYMPPVQVALGATNNATIRYTTDGTTPTTASSLYAAPLTFDVTTTLKAKAFHPDYTASAETTAVYTMLVAETPTFTPDAGAYAGGQAITIATTTPDATIRYTLNGADPTTLDPVIASGASVVVGDYTLKAAAFKTGYATSAVKAAVYNTTSNLHAGRIGAGRSHTAIVKSDGTVWAWGADGVGQLGDGPSQPSTSRGIPGPTLSLTGVTAAAGGYDFTLALRTDGSVWAWGSNASGQLGDGTQVDQPAPFEVPTTRTYVGVAVGESHSLAVKADGTVYAWGSNSNGQLGDGTTTLRTSPVQVPGLTGVVAVSAGRWHSHALKSDGTVWGWGYSGQGQVGDGYTIQRSAPAQVDGLTSITAIASSTSAGHTVALRADGSVWVWGSNAWGQAGDGGTLDHLTPARATSLPTSAIAIAAGDDHTLALAADGHVWAWGQGGSGQLGNGEANQSTVALQVSGPADIVALGASSSHSHALSSDGFVWSWGSGDAGTIGDGRRVNALTPTRVSEANFDWKVGTPTISVASGTYSTPQTSTVAVENTGATIRYTTDGTEPDETDMVVASGDSMAIDQSLTLKVKAWKAGMPASNIGSETYTLEAVAPTATPGGGTYTALQTVSLATTTAGATIRYTTDATEPTEASTLYSVPVNVSTATTLKAKAFKTDWNPSTVTTATYTMNFGTLAAPTTSPAPGTYASSVEVTLSAPNGAIRYTTDGTTPTTTSALYTAPLTFTLTTTLKATAFHPDYTASAVTTAVYTKSLGVPAKVYLNEPSGNVDGTAMGWGWAYRCGGSIASREVVVDGVVRAASFTPGIEMPGVQADEQAECPSVPLNVGYIFSFDSRTLSFGTHTMKIRVVDDLGVTTDSNERTINVQPIVRLWLDGQQGPARGSVIWGWGWAFRCDAALSTYELLLDGTVDLITTFDLGGSRPDVQAAYLELCPALTDAAGFYYTIDTSRLALGDHEMRIRVTDGLGNSYTSNAASFTVGGFVAAGGDHSLAVTQSGVPWSWGRNADGQLGSGGTSEQRSPVPVSGSLDLWSVTAGGAHSLAMQQADGVVLAWGRNDHGQLGDGTTQPRTEPTVVPGLEWPYELVAGGRHSLARFAGVVHSWGANDFGQIGNGGSAAVLSPTAITTPGDVTTMAAGRDHSVVVLADGTAWSWGHNGEGQLGDGTTNDSNVPVQVSGLTNVVAVFSGPASDHTFAVKNDGSIWAWGRNVSGQLGNATTSAYEAAPVAVSLVGAASLAAGAEHSVALMPDRTVRTWGDNTAGQLGEGTGPGRSTPEQLDGVTGVLMISTGREHTLAVTSNSAVLAWGGNGFGQSGHTDTAPRTVPEKVAEPGFRWKAARPTLSVPSGTYPTDQHVVLVSATPGALVHYTLDGSSPSTSSPSVVSGSAAVVPRSADLVARAVAPGFTLSDPASAIYTIALAAPTISPAAGAYTGPLSVTITSGAPNAVIRYTTTGAEPGLASPIYATALLLEASATVRARAFLDGATASATATSAYTITPASGVVATPTLSVESGFHTTTRLVTVSTVTALATIHYSTDGAEPNESDLVVSSGSAVTVGKSLILKAKAWKTGLTPSGVVRGDYVVTGGLAIGSGFSLALRADKTVWGWGGNANGELGLGTTSTTVLTPTESPTLADVSAIAAGTSHGLALDDSGDVWAWGLNADGQVGDNSTTTHPTPVQVLSDVVAIAAAGLRSAAVKSNGTVWQWGAGTLTPTVVSGVSAATHTTTGALRLALESDGTLADWTAAPPNALASAGIVSVSSIGGHAAALETGGALAGSVITWGDDSSGQLGDGGADFSGPTPRRVLHETVAVAAGGAHTLAVTPRGAAWSWGDNSAGQLGDAAHASRTTPGLVTALADVLTASAGTDHSGAVLAGGSVALWGANVAGQLGRGATSANEPTPVQVATFSLVDNAWLLADDDGDGLMTYQEYRFGTDPLNGDTNGDGMEDGLSVAVGRNPRAMDLDGDGLSNADELLIGTDPLNPDTDGDGARDGVDGFPLDPDRSEPPLDDPLDNTPPVITLLRPSGAALVSTQP
jgi:alpha-tubulin suppressor-like RCC1 family protein